LKVSFLPDAIESRIGSKITDVLVTQLESLGEPFIGEFFLPLKA